MYSVPGPRYELGFCDIGAGAAAKAGGLASF